LLILVEYCVKPEEEHWNSAVKSLSALGDCGLITLVSMLLEFLFSFALDSPQRISNSGKDCGFMCWEGVLEAKVVHVSQLNCQVQVVHLSA
jgi:hypothetical protein